MSDNRDQVNEPREEIAIIGMAGRFPGAKNVEEFWCNLREGVESIRSFSDEELRVAGADDATFNDSSYVKAGAVLDDAEAFDADFFGINPREAEIMDPQHRALLECAWAAIEDAGYDPETFDGPIGVFGGVAQNTYFQYNLIARPDILEAVGHYPAMIATEKEYSVTRISYKLNLKGPSVFLNTACSTSGVAIHIACQSVLSGECDMALAGGCRIKVPLMAGYQYQEDGILSPDGHCRAFDANARGTVVGSGVAMILIKPLSDAIRHGDTIYAVIKGTTINNDGAAKIGFTAPSIQGQAALIGETLAIAEVNPDTIGYVEAHGTGTSLGDPIEIAALTKAYRKSTNLKNYCAIGSVKTNIGHLDAGAGAAGIIKTALALKHRLIPPSLNFEEPNPQIDFDNSPFYVNDKLSEWPRNEHPRRAGVSSFGLGGTNAHIILEEAPPIEPSSTDRPCHLLVLSAKTDKALEHATENLVAHFKKHPDLNLSDVAYTLQLGRRAFNHRRMLVCRDIDGAIAAMETLDPKRVVSDIQEAGERPVVFMFSGQGSQYVQMASELYQVEWTFREQIDACAEILKPHLGLDIRHVLYPPVAKMDAATRQLNQTHITQPVLFVIEYALAKLWMAWGVHPQAMIGHSIGEYVAACLAGVFSLQDALALVASRGRLMQQLPDGAMLAIPLSEEEVQFQLGDQLSLAAVNGPSLCVVSGPMDAVEALQNQLAERGVEGRRLHTSHAFHSAMMEPILETFTEQVKEVNLQPPQIPYISNVSGTWITKTEATDPAYWAKHIRQTVRFSDGLQVLLQDSDRLLIEVGAGQTLSTFARRHPAKVKRQTVVSSLRHPKEDTPDLVFMLNSLGRLWLAGAKSDWSQFYAGELRHRVPLPTYPFERKRYWIEAVTRGKETDDNSTFTTEAVLEVNEDLTLEDHNMSPTPKKNRKERIVSELKSLIEDLSGIDPADLDIHATFLELGFDSLLLTQANTAFKRKFEVKISFRQLFEETPTINALAEYIDNQLPPEAFPDETPQIQSKSTSQTAPLVSIESLPGGSASGSIQGTLEIAEGREATIATALENLILQQIQANTQLLEILKGRNRLQKNLSSPSALIKQQPTSTARKEDYPVNKASVKRDRWELDFEAELSALSRRESSLERELGIKGMDAYDGLEQDLNDLCSAYLCRYFQSCDIEMSKGSSYKVSELQRILRIVPKFEKFFHYMLKILTEDKIIELDNGKIQFLKDRTVLKDPESLRDSLMKNHPQFMGIFEMLDHCAKHFRDALSGEMPAIQVLFPDGSRDLIKTNLEDNTVEHQRLRIYKLLTKELILKLSANSPVRILEVGAGSGSLTWQLVPALQDRDVTYYFTDIGRTFVNAAKKEATRRGLGMMKFGVLDIAKDPEEQGFKPESFDIILALNVVHATPDIESTLGNLKKLLMPRGFICLIELITAHRWTNLVWGTTEGWWYFNDHYRRYSPLVDFDQWEKASRNKNFGSVYALPLARDKRYRTDSGLILALRNEPSTISKETTPARPASTESVAGGISGLGPWKPVQQRSNRLSDTQQQYLDALIKRFTDRTQESKRLTQAHRANLADPRTASGFQLPWKELVYPIVATKSSGSKFRDVDGNEWLDITMGFGVSLFGHSPPFITKAIEKQLKNSMATGPQTTLAGKAADLLCELTGMERAAFCNTGSEAVLAAIRIARNVTGRDRIALFSGAYHGIFDEVLVKGISTKGLRRSVPVASGIPRKAVEDVLVLDYGDFNSLDIIKNHTNELAAILVEPIQSRNPEIQPREFLHALRDLTEKQNIPLIFDEMITGFRLHLGGAQAYFGVKADIAAYGKVIGGGMPIGIVAGQAEYMDALDGGMWNYGDDSVPEVGTTWFAGTFVRHPLSMAAVHAALRQLKKCGPKLQEDLNNKTSQFVRDLNSYFEQNQMPIRLVHFGSLFLIKFLNNQQFSGLFWHFLRDNGIHCHEGRPNYFTTAHTEKDIAYLVKSFKKAAQEMRAGGFLPETSSLEPFDKSIISTPESIPPIEKDKTPGTGIKEIPLTDAQLEIWLATCLGDEASCAFNVSTSLYLKGPLQVDPLRDAMNQVCNRHEALRTTISKDGDCQCIAETLKIDMPFTDLSGLKHNEQEAEIKVFQKNEVEEPFDLAEGPLLRARIIKIAQDQHLVVFTAHHIICDGWSLEIIIQDLSTFYSSSIGTASVDFKEVMQFSEFTDWLKDQQGDTLGTDTETFWLGKFSDSVPALELPVDRPRPPIKTYSCMQQSLVIDSKQFKELGRFATENGCTIFSILLAAYCILIRRLSDQEDIVVGLAAGGQSSIGNKKLVGHCVNLLPIRSQISAGQKFSDYLASVRNLLFDAFEYPNYSFGSLIKKLNLPRDVSRIPLISATITYENSAKGIQFEGLDASLISNLRSYCNFDLEFYLRESNDELIIRFDYNTDLFDDSTIRRWLENYKTLLSAILSDPSQRIKQLPLLTKKEQHQLIVEWNKTERNYPQNTTLVQLFEEQVDRSPETVAVEYEGRQLTYRELNSRANQLAHHLIALRVGPEVMVGLYMERSLETVIGIFGIIKAGGAYVPLDPEYPSDRVAFMIEDTDVPVLLTQEKLVASLPEQRAKVIRLDSGWNPIAGESTENPHGGAAPNNLAYVMYTSGSTGQPKGVMISHKAICNHMFWMQNAYPFFEFDRVLQKTPFGFDASIWEFYAPLFVGGQLIMAKPDGHRDSSYLIEAIQKHKITILQLVPSLLQLILDESDFDRCSSLRRVFCGGETLPFELVEQFFSIHRSELVNLYGPTEAAIDITSWVCKRYTDNQIVPIGRPVSNTRIYILDQFLQPVPIGVHGELHIGSVQVARGYLNRPKLTKEKFISDPFTSEPGSRLYKTGDLARYLPDGAIEYLGRSDFQVKIRGLRIELGEIEAVLSNHPAVKGQVVVAHELKPGDNRIIAYIVPKNKDISIAELRTHLAAKVPNYMIPSLFMKMETFPLTSNGKIDRKSLPAPDGVRPDLESSFVPPRTPVEEKIAAIWTKILGLEQIGVHDNFFDLGGHSLLAVRLVAQIEKVFGKKLPLATIFPTPTIEKLADTLHQEEEPASWHSVVPLQPNGSYPPLFGIHSTRYHTLARYLSPEQPIYALRYGHASEISEDIMTLPERLEDLASHYIEEMQTIQPEGPYFLIGLCIGALVAFEMAQQLVAKGQQVALLALADPIIQSGKIPLPFRTKASNLLQLGPVEALKRGQKRVIKKLSILNGNTSNRAQIKYHSYEPKTVYPGKAIIIKTVGGVSLSSTFDPELGWGKSVSGGLKIHEVHSGHTELFEEPAVGETAEILKACLVQAQEDVLARV